jgi:hypothetical protein
MAHVEPSTCLCPKPLELLTPLAALAGGVARAPSTSSTTTVSATSLGPVRDQISDTGKLVLAPDVAMELRADFTRREMVPPGGEAWRPSPVAGVECYLLDRIGDEVARETSTSAHGGRSAVRTPTPAARNSSPAG